MILRVHYNGLVYLGVRTVHQFGIHLVLITVGASYSGTAYGFSVIPHKFTAVFMLHSGQFFMPPLPLSHLAI